MNGTYSGESEGDASPDVIALRQISPPNIEDYDDEVAFFGSKAKAGPPLRYSVKGGELGGAVSNRVLLDPIQQQNNPSLL